MVLSVALLMSAVALWRLPGVRFGDPLRRTLWGCSAAFAITLWARFPAVKSVLGQTGIVDFDALVKYLVSIAACLSLLNFSVTSYLLAGNDAPRHIAISQRAARIARRSLVVAVPLMIGLFFFGVDRDFPSADFAADHAGEPGAAAFMTVYYAYLGASAWTVAYQWTHICRRAESRGLRVGLALGAASTWIYTVYAPARLLYMWGAMLVPASPSVERTVASLGNAVNVLAAALFAVGASLPTTHVVADRWRSWRCLWQLYPLRRDLTRAFPWITFQPSGSRLREMTRLTPPLEVRLDGWIQEVGDAADLLRHHATPHLWQAAQRAAYGHDDPESAAEAQWIKAALASVASSCRSSVPAGPLPDKPFATSLGEAYWLLRVQAAYSRITPQETRLVLVEAGAPCLQEQDHCLVHQPRSAAPESAS